MCASQSQKHTKISRKRRNQFAILFASDRRQELKCPFFESHFFLLLNYKQQQITQVPDKFQRCRTQGQTPPKSLSI